MRRNRSTPEVKLPRMVSFGADTFRGICGNPAQQVVVIQTRTATLETTRATLDACQCDYFDRALSRPWSSTDRFGRPKLQLDFDSEVFPHTLMCLQNQADCTPWEDARARELARQLDFLCPRPPLVSEKACDLPSQVSLPLPPPGFVRLAADTFRLRIPTPVPTDVLPATAVEAGYTVKITRPFYMQATPVTQEQWQALMGNNPSHFAAGMLDSHSTATCPVENVSWYDALAYCNALSRQEGLPPSYDLRAGMGTPGAGPYRVPGNITFSRSATGYRLPTHAEWRYAARAGGGALPPEEPESPPAANAWTSLIFGGGNAEASTHPVACHAPNAWGLYDLQSNVYEWVWNAVFDAHGQIDDLDSETVAVDPRGHKNGHGRVLCGSDYTAYQQAQRDANMAFDYANWSYDVPHRSGHNTGFRPVRAFDLEQEAQGLPRMPACR
jgi:formylglycine-generating enzyme required for sulfatase activity